MEQVVEEGGQRPMDVGVLAATMAIAADQGGPAVEALGFDGVSVGPEPAVRGLDCRGKHPAGDCIADSFDVRHRIPPSAPYRAAVALAKGRC
jgi:hypothetical protein